MKNFFSNLASSFKKHIHINSNNEPILNQITIKYGINEKDNKIRIFGEKFVNNNKDKCKLTIYDNEYELCEYINKDIIPEKSDILEIKLTETLQVTNLSDMFSYCDTLLPISDFSNWNTTNVNNMSAMFSYCSLLTSLPNISNWNTENVNNMSQMFSFCKSLLNLPDISNWKTKNVRNMSWMFAHCEKLSSFPEISKWKTKNVNNMSYMFYCCHSLTSLPNISRWKTKSINNKVGMVGMFEGCKKSLQVPRKFQNKYESD